MEDNYDARRVLYSTAMKEMFKQTPKTMTKPLSPSQKYQIIMTEIGGGWYMETITKGLSPLMRPN